MTPKQAPDDDYLGIPARHVEYLCAVMHSAYEDEAARVGWDTNPRSKTSWDRVPEQNKQAMRAGVRALLDRLFRPEPATARSADEPTESATAREQTAASGDDSADGEAER